MPLSVRVEDLHVGQGPVLQEEGEAGVGVRYAPGGQHHVDGSAAPRAAGVHGHHLGRQKKFHAVQLAVEARHVEDS